MRCLTITGTFVSFAAVIRIFTQRFSLLSITGGPTDPRTDGPTEADGPMERQTDGTTDRRNGRPTERQTDGKTDRRNDRPKERPTDKSIHQQIKIAEPLFVFRKNTMARTNEPNKPPPKRSRIGSRYGFGLANFKSRYSEKDN